MIMWFVGFRWLNGLRVTALKSKSRVEAVELWAYMGAKEHISNY